MQVAEMKLKREK